MHKKPNIVPAEKIQNLPTYIFAELDEWKEAARARGFAFVDLGMGNPDGATPDPIVRAAVDSIKNPVNHGYPSFKGRIEFRRDIAKWMKLRYNVDIDPETEIQTLIGAKEGLAHIALAYTNPGDINIVPDPYYPVLSRGTWIASGEVYHVPLKEENNYLPDLKSIPEDVAKKAKMFFVNYPNNPTAAVATKEFYKELVDFCIENDILLVTDLAYGEVTFDNYRPLSIFEIEGAKSVAVEFHSFSKTFNMAGWRVGFVVGAKEFISNIHKTKTNIDYGTSGLVQDAAMCALNIDYSYVQETMDKYYRRMKLMVDGLNKLGWNLKYTIATMYLWLKVPEGYDSMTWCRKVFDEAGVVFTPGIAFGKYSDNYCRVSLVASDEKLLEALERLEKAGIHFCMK
ncbi:MAG: LL-diaminopimelate aminotransferase [Candidatus Gastranaerophilales bacterium]|nr:LL-diaminopimelate aminotransferase [Candidatus Gastranaerophilales bacterium]